MNNINNMNNMNITILLTCTCRVQDNITWLVQRNSSLRRDMYVINIKKWLKNTDFNIVVVENSGYKFNELNKYVSDRFEIISFDYSEIDKDDQKKLKKMRSKGQHEVYSINYAYNKSKIIKKTEYLFKLTGRYFIPNFISILKKHNYKKYDYIVQHDADQTVLNTYDGDLLPIGPPKRCELVGCQISMAEKLFGFPLNNDHMEIEMYNRLSNLSILVLPKMMLDKSTIQGGGYKMYYL